MNAPSQHEPLVTIVINNYNYGRYLGQAIDSALRQDDGHFEVIVVDDGSSDDSVAVARARMSPRLRVIEKRNGGQASAFNAGFAAARGEWIMFLDADDWYAPDAVRTVRGEFREGVAKVQFQLIYYFEALQKPGWAWPPQLSRGDVTGEIAASGNYVWPPTSGNVFNRRALAKIMPMPEAEFRICADAYLCVLIAACGRIAAVDRPLGHYRIHASNGYARKRWFSQGGNLQSHCVGPLRITQLTERVCREKGVLVGKTLMDFRHNIEQVAIAARFGVLRLEDFGLSRAGLSDLWQRNYRSLPPNPRRRLPAFIAWKAINHAPEACLKLLLHVRNWIWHHRWVRDLKRKGDYEWIGGL